MLFAVREPLRQNIWQTIRSIMDIFHVLPPAAAAAVFYLMGFDDQVRELYASELSKLNYTHVGFAVLGFGLVSAVIYASHHLLSSIRQKIIFANFMRRNVGGNLRLVRWFFGMLWASAPWLGMAVGLGFAQSHIAQDQDLIDAVFGELHAQPPSLILPTESFALAAGFVIIAVAAVGTLYLLNKAERSRLLLSAFAGIVLALLAAALAVAAFDHDFIDLYRRLGPLATLSLQILFVLSLTTAFAFLSQHTRFPATTLVVAAIVIGIVAKVPFRDLALWFGLTCAVMFLIAVFARLKLEAIAMSLLCALALCAWWRDVADVRQHDPNLDQFGLVRPGPPLPTATVAQSFQTWLSRKPASDKPYPVFIIAAPGGGVYAAAAAALFLARMQDDEPCFADHVFAISAVSGGAIGASVFHTLARRARDSASSGPENCTRVIGNSTDGPLAASVAEFIEADYFSPVIAAIFPDFVGLRWGRAETLDRSFIEAIQKKDQLAARMLAGWYITHWDEGRNPALVLNTTSAETGYRVAFAPFRLNDGSDRSVYSFADRQFFAAAADPPKKCLTQVGPGGKTINNTVQDASLMFAAVTSARFPLILPPYATTSLCGNTLNFVDGGYADNSGAATALDIYRALLSATNQDDSSPTGQQHYRRTAVEGHALVDLKVILITSDDPLPDLLRTEGTEFRDMVAPIDAILEVRNELADQAVARACDYVQQTQNVADTCNTPQTTESASPWSLGLVRLEDQAYALPLGWRVSDPTVRVISSLIGRPLYCSGVPAQLKQARDVVNNSCVLLQIEIALDTFYGGMGEKILRSSSNGAQTVPGASP
jgi:hypothetical protein